MSEGTKPSDIVIASLWGCLTLGLFSIIPLLVFLSGLLIIINGHVFWGLCLMVLAVLNFVGPFYAASRSKTTDEKSADESAEKKDSQ